MRQLYNPAVETAPAGKGMGNTGSDKKCRGPLKRKDSILYADFTFSVPAYGKFVLIVKMPVIVKFPVAAYLKTKRIAGAWIYNFFFRFHGFNILQTKNIV
jgi:hypothetical protein